MSSESLSVCNVVAAAFLVQLLCLCRHASSSSILLSNETDRLALLSFKSMITSDPFGALSSWNDSIHFCKWYGVYCSRRHYGRVTALILPSQRLSGSISTHVGNLSFLEFLGLHNNSFVGEIPQEIGRLRRLQDLALFRNSFDGKMPSNISKCSALRMFVVAQNKLVGEIPWQYGQLSKLETFNVRLTNLHGSIPPAFGNLSSLEVFNVNENQLHGEIPPSIFNLSSLKSMWFGLNQFHGNIPWNLGLLLPNLEVFDVGDNQFTGSVPPSLSNASNLVILQINGNNFTGSMPSMEVSSKLTRFTISRNSLGSGKANDLKFLSSLTNVTSLEFLQIQRNNFGGHLLQDIGNWSTTRLKYLSFHDNKIYGNIPSGIQSLINLEVLSGSNNDLSGTLPSSIGNLKSLAMLFLLNNKLSGDIPSSIGNLTELLHLNIKGNNIYGEIPASIQNWKRLLSLSLSNNNLNGVISPQIMSFRSILSLDLSHNQFTGGLPIEVGNLKSLGKLDLSHNALSGNIPSSLGSCINLEYLYLQGNRLQGVIPSSLSSLRGIQELDLSVNNLSGQIPKFLELMNISGFLNLSYNNFEGEIPTQGVFKNKSIVSVSGNSKLCGGIVALKLPPCNFTIHSTKSLSLKWKIVISTISSLLFLAFVGSCFFILLVKKRGRQDAVSTDDPKLLQLSYQMLFNATDGFSSTNQIGAGSFGTVYKGVLEDISEMSIKIAVKVFNLQRRGASKSFMAECEVLKNIKHKNLVKIVTVCSSVDHDGNDFKALIYELLVNGSLEDWLHRPIERIDESTTRILSFIQRLNVAIDIASAVDYLHNNCGTPIVHCDLKPSNVLLDEDMVAHVGDFGLARFLSIVENPSSSTIGIKGTVGYAPPEYGMGNEISIQGDIYSYGILLLELFIGKRPTDESFRDGLSLHNFVMGALSEQDTFEVVDPVLLNELLQGLTTHHNYTSRSLDETRKDLEELMSSILEIGITCSLDIPEERISMGEVLSGLTAIKKKLVPVERK